MDKLIRQRGGKLPVKEAMAILCDVLDGLEYAHHAPIPNVKLKDGSYGEGNGFVHRDLYDTPQKLDQWFRWCVTSQTDTLNKYDETTPKNAQRSFQGQG
ncbi:MAG: hypothetical protein ACLQM8_25070, partial [Limisphaerales bacterium]